LEAKAAAIKEDLEALKRADAAKRELDAFVGIRTANAMELKKREADRAVATAIQEIQRAMHRLREVAPDRQMEAEVLRAIEQAVGEMRRKAGGGDQGQPPQFQNSRP
jgi:hypothetical protein